MIVVGVPHSIYRGVQIQPGKVVEDVWGCLDVSQVEEGNANATPLATLGTGAAAK